MSEYYVLGLRDLDVEMVARVGMNRPSSLCAGDVRKLARRVREGRNAWATRGELLDALRAALGDRVGPAVLQLHLCVDLGDAVTLLVPQCDELPAGTTAERYDRVGMMFVDDGAATYAYPNLGAVIVDVANGERARGFRLADRLIG